jgi:hypothetical protein
MPQAPPTTTPPIWVSEPVQVGPETWECFVHAWAVDRPVPVRSGSRDGTLYLAARFLEMVLRDHSDIVPPNPPSPDPPGLTPLRKR